MRHLLTLFDLSPSEVQTIFSISEDLKSKFDQGIREPLLPGRMAALLFEKPSLRTRVSFETAMTHLGGSSMFLGADVGWGTRESIEDFSRVLCQYVDVIICRAKNHDRVVELADHADRSVINGLTNLSHPCQALADLFTLHELNGSLSDCTLAFVGDGNNVARSLAVACAMLNVTFRFAAPAGYELDKAFVQEIELQFPGAKIQQTANPKEAVDGAHAIYTDVWASMGQEAEKEVRQAAFAEFQVTGELMKLAAPEAAFLHCLPAQRGEEVSAEVMDGPQSAVIQQAGNRMHVQKGILAWLLGAQQ